MVAQNVKAVDAVQSAMDAHDIALNLESSAEPNVQLWNLLYSLHDWCIEHDLDLEKEVREARADWLAASSAA